MIDLARQQQLASAETPQPPAMIQIGPAVRAAGAAGTGIRRAFCKTDAGGGDMIQCYLDYDVSGTPETWNSDATYTLNSLVTYGNYTWKSLKAGNKGHIPAEGEWWTNIEITVSCDITNSPDLFSALPRLVDGSALSVWNDGGVWRAIQLFQGSQDCDL